MKKEYMKPAMCVVELMISSSLLVGSEKGLNNYGDSPIGRYHGDEEIIDEDDVI